MSNDFYSGIYNPDVLSCLANLSNDISAQCVHR